MDASSIATSVVWKQPAGVPDPGQLASASLPPSAAHIRGTEFFEPDVTAEYKRRFDKAWHDGVEAREALAREYLADARKRALVRAEEIVDGLLTVVANKGEGDIKFAEMFTLASRPDFSDLMKDANTPAARRDLHTLLKSFSEIPKTWARSAWVRLLRGTGKQASDKFNYTGKGMFGVNYGWKQEPLNALCDLLISGRPDYWYVRNNLLANVMGTSADVEDEYRAKEKQEGEPDEYFDARFTVRIEKNKPLIKKMLQILEDRGLGDIPDAIEKDPPKARKVKEFKIGDRVTRANLRDLPLPAIVEVPVMAETWTGTSIPKKRELEPKTLYWVVEKLFDDGTFKCAFLREMPSPDASPKSLVAYYEDPGERPSWWNTKSKEFLHKATYLGKFEGSHSRKDAFKYEFHLQLPDYGQDN